MIYFPLLYNTSCSLHSVSLSLSLRLSAYTFKQYKEK